MPTSLITNAAIPLFAAATGNASQVAITEIGFGDGGNPDLLAARGTHGNLSEHAPIFLIMLAILELANANHIGITVIAAIFLVGRVSHIVGMGQHHNWA